MLVVAHGDGWLEVFADRSTDVRIERLPIVQSVDGEIKVEQWLEGRLPWRYRDLYWPVNRRVTEMLQPLTITDLVDSEHRRICSKALDCLQRRAGR